MRLGIPTAFATLALLVLLGVAPPAWAFGEGLGFEPSCWATGLGALGPPLGDDPQGDLFWGFAASDGSDAPQEAAGQWLHLTPLRVVPTRWGAQLRRDLFAGRVEFASCSQNGHFVVTVQGSGSWNGVPGHRFQVVITDRSAPGDAVDSYSIVIVGPDDELVYHAEGDIVRGGVVTSGSQ